MSCCNFSSSFGGAGSGGGARPTVYVLPEQWSQTNVAAGQTNVVVAAQFSTSFDTFRVLRAGSIIGLSTRLTEAVAAGTLTVEVTLNGAGTGLTVVSTSGSNASGGVTTQDAGIDAYVVGDLIGVRLTSSVGFLPITTDLEAMIQVSEGP